MGCIGKREPKQEEKKVPLWKLLRYTSRVERIMLLVGILSSLAHGTIQPLFIVIFGDVLDELGNATSLDEMLSGIQGLSLNFVYLSIFAFIVSYLQVSMFSQVGQIQTNKIRRKYLRGIMRQEMAFFDKNQSRELMAKFESSIPLIHDAISEKLGLFCQFFSVFISGFSVSLYHGWKVGLVTLSATPVQILVVGFTARLLMIYSDRGIKLYSKAGAFADEVFSAIKTVTVFGGQAKEEKKYSEGLDLVMTAGIKRSYVESLGISATFFIVFNLVSLSLYYGSTLVKSGELTTGEVVTAFFGVMLGSMGIGMMTPSIVSISNGRGAAYGIFEVIDRKSEIDSLTNEGEKPKECKGSISFENVTFKYPTRPDVQVLKGISFNVEPGKTVALVGKSGCGKSTTISLLEKFYSPETGSVKVDGIEISKLNTKWLRSKIGLVSQEPTLFVGTVAENISLGKEGATMEEIVEASKLANAYDFIMSLPENFNTLVQPRGANLSGGQKQRIAIARALIRDPPILLLDEATSALDSKSEEVVQDALDKARSGRSTIIIAHRLSTIKNADMILVFEQGKIVESGNHSQLMRMKGLYKDFVKVQSLKEKKKKSKKEDKEITTTLNPTKKELEKSYLKNTSNQIYAPENVSGLKRSYKLNFEKEKKYIIAASLLAIFNGACFPAFSSVLAQILYTMMTKVGDELQEDMNFWCLMVLVIATITAVGNYLQRCLFLISGEKFTKRIREMCYSAIIRQSATWFDRAENHSSILSATLSQEIPQIQKATGKLIGASIRVISAVIAGASIGLSSCTYLGAALIACLPLIATGNYLKMRTLKGFSAQQREAYQNSSIIASEAVENIKTVLSLGKDNHFQSKYKLEIMKPQHEAMKDSQFNGIGMGYAESIVTLTVSLAFYYGSNLVVDQECTPESILRTMFSIMVVASIIGDSFHIFSDFKNAQDASKKIFEYIDTRSEPDVTRTDGLKPDTCLGNVTLNNVYFSYPSRPDSLILGGCSIDIQQGKTLALVGNSGCGKSTILSMIERLYDPIDGSIQLDGHNIKDLNLDWLRQQIAFVSQEPILFATTISENIKYGAQDATEEQIEKAAKIANAHDFISKLPEGYNTFVGERGTQLSGGQKQRIAIARAIVRNPKILLLDEATSALDTESEKIVQEALNNAKKGRTTIVVAHRLSTIKDADKIAVLDSVPNSNGGRGGGVVVQVGTHSQLIKQKKGKYYAFLKIQKLHKS